MSLLCGKPSLICSHLSMLSPTHTPSSHNPTSLSSLGPTSLISFSILFSHIGFCCHRCFVVSHHLRNSPTKSNLHSLLDCLPLPLSLSLSLSICFSLSHISLNHDCTSTPLATSHNKKESTYSSSGATTGPRANRKPQRGTTEQCEA